jgi:tryptophanyl-tRNA synthetase
MADGIADRSEKVEKPPKVEGTSVEQKVTPWQVVGSVADDGKELGINYDKLIEQFGTRRIDEELLNRFKEVTGHEPHRLLRRRMFFSHRQADRIPHLCTEH